MAAHTGITLGESKVILLPNSALSDTDLADFEPSRAWISDTGYIFGLQADVQMQQPVDNKDGISLGDFADLWYNHLHIIPNRINVGNLTSQQVRPIEIFNGYFEPREISAATPTDLSGVDFDIALPLTLAALESVYRNLTINTVGTPQFDGYFDFTVDDAKGHYFLYVAGKRVLVMPFQHNWSDPVGEKLAWYNSSSGKSLDGIEQLQMWRDKPRRTLSYDFLLASTHSNAARLRALFAALMHGWQTRIFAVPIWTDATRLTTEAAAGQNVVQVNTAYFDYDAGSYLMLWKDEENYELIEIDEVAANQITLKVNLTNTWIAKRTVVMPARLAYISQQLSGQKHTVDLDTVPVSFELLPQFPSLNRIVNAAQTMYRSYPVLLTKNNYNPTAAFDISQSPIRNDANTGIFSLEADQPAPDTSNGFSFLFANHAQVAAYYGWLDKRKGRLTPFWQPTWSHDMQVVQDIASGANGMLIKAIGYTSLYYVDAAPVFNRRDIMIRLKTGQMFFRRITGAGINEDGTETINLDTVLGQNVLTSQIDRVSFLIPSALKADVVDITWLSGNISQSSVQIADVYDDTI